MKRSTSLVFFKIKKKNIAVSVSRLRFPRFLRNQTDLSNKKKHATVSDSQTIKQLSQTVAEVRTAIREKLNGLDNESAKI